MLSAFQAHAGGLGGARFLGATIISCGTDGKILLRSRDNIDSEAKALSKPKSGPVTSIVVHPARQQVATVEEGEVHVYDIETDQHALAVRSFQPVLALAYDRTGNKLAIAGQDRMIDIKRVKSPTDGSSTLRVAELRRIEACENTSSLAFDPDAKYLAGLTTCGSLQVWDTLDYTTVVIKKSVAPKCAEVPAAKAGIAWTADGSTLAFPSPNGQVVLLSRTTWEEAGRLDNSRLVGALAFSPNGRYLATAGQTDTTLAVWDVRSKQKVSEQRGSSALTSIDWEHSGNCLLLMSLEGKLIVWEGVVPPALDGPCDVCETSGVSGDPQSLTNDGESKGSPRDAGASRDDEDAGGRLDAFDEIIQQAGGSREDRGAKQVSRAAKADVGVGRAISRLQPAFQSAETPAGEGSQRWLAYNLSCGIRVTDDAGMSIMDVSFHDVQARNARVQPYRDVQNLEIAALGAKGAVYARRGGRKRGEEPLLVWRPFEARFKDSDWTRQFPSGQRIEAIAGGRSFIAAATSDRELHIFGTGGMQMALFSLHGPPITLAAVDNVLAAVWHGSPPTKLEDQSLAFAIYDVNSRMQKCSGQLPISPGSSLIWLGFSAEGLLASYDSTGILRVRTEDFGGSWVPMFTGATQDAESTLYPVGVTNEHFICIECQGEAVPSVHVPDHRLYPLEPMVCGLSQDTQQLEAELLLRKGILRQMQARLDDGPEYEDLAELEADFLAEQNKADRTSIKLFAEALKSQRHMRALELAAGLNLQRSLEATLKLTNLHKVPALAEHLALLLQNKIEEEAEEVDNVITPLPAPAFTPTFDEPAIEAAAGTEISGNAELDASDPAIAGSETKPSGRSYGSGSSIIPCVAHIRKSAPLGQALKPKNSAPPLDPLDEGKKRKAAPGNPFLRRTKAAK